jgi:hypothetical protein
MNNKKREEALWKELDNLAFWLSAVAIIILCVVYFILPSLVTSPFLLNFLLSIITNLIPVCLLFVLSYTFLRRIQTIRSDKDNEILIMQISSTIRGELLSDLRNTQSDVADEIIKFQTEISKLDRSVQEQNQKKRIIVLFVTADPVDVIRLRIGNEIRQIKKALRNSQFGASFELIVEVGVTRRDLQALLIEYQPSIFHFAGVSVPEGIVLENEIGKSDIVSEDEICNLMSNYSNRTQLVFLNGNALIGEKISEKFDFVISPNDAVGDFHASQFSAAFYQSIFNNNDIETAYELGCASLAGTPDNNRYRLFKPKKNSYRYFLPIV